MKKELAILLSGLTAMLIIFASAFAIGLAGRVHAEERKNNRQENTTFENNTAGTGGAIYWNGESNTNTLFMDNTAESDRAVIAFEPDPNFHPSFMNNAAESGGAVVALGPDPNFHTSFMDNTAESGGAIYWHDKDKADIPFINNTADFGGAIFVR